MPLDWVRRGGHANIQVRLLTFGAFQHRGSNKHNEREAIRRTSSTIFTGETALRLTSQEKNNFSQELIIMIPHLTPSRMPARSLATRNLTAMKQRLARAFMRQQRDAWRRPAAARQISTALLFALVLGLVGLLSLNGWRSAARQQTTPSGQPGLAAALHPVQQARGGHTGMRSLPSARQHHKDNRCWATMRTRL